MDKMQQQLFFHEHMDSYASSNSDATLSMRHNMYHVVGTFKGLRFSRSFITLRAARKYFNRCKNNPHNKER